MKAGLHDSAAAAIGAGRLEILIADANDRHDRAALLGLDDRILARLEPRADERFRSGQHGFLMLGIGQVNHLGDEVAGEHLREVFGRQLERE